MQSKDIDMHLDSLAVDPEEVKKEEQDDEV